MKHQLNTRSISATPHRSTAAATARHRSVNDSAPSSSNNASTVFQSEEPRIVAVSTSSASAHTRASAQNGCTTIGDLSISFGKYTVEKNGTALDLTSKEFEILALLAANPGQVFTRQQIYEHIWGEGNAVDTNSITVFIRRIREKIEDNASQPKYLLTVWGVGYKFAE